MRLPDLSHALKLLDATIFLYPSKEDAERGTAFGGSGVMIGVPMKARPDLLVRYAITNWHVACDGGNSVIRFTDPATRQPCIVDKDSSEWLFIPGRQDLAVTELHLPVGMKPTILPAPMIVTSDDAGGAFIGDDVFMAGRFIDYDGRETNKPALRFGAISMLDALVEQPTGYRGQSVVVDMHSRTGFSGSPVYIYRPGDTWVGHGAPPPQEIEGLYLPTQRTWGMGNNTILRLLGLQWGQFPESWEINRPASPTGPEASLIRDGAYVTGFSGMSCVIPGDDIRQLLNLPQLVADRDRTAESVSYVPVPEWIKNLRS